MGQVLHGCAATTHTVRAAIQRSQASIAELSRIHGVNPKTVAKWKKREGVNDAPMGPGDPRSTVLSKEEEALAVAFRKHTVAARRLSLRTSSDDPAPDALFTSPALSTS